MLCAWVATDFLEGSDDEDDAELEEEGDEDNVGAKRKASTQVGPLCSHCLCTSCHQFTMCHALHARLAEGLEVDMPQPHLSLGRSTC